MRSTHPQNTRIRLHWEHASALVMCATILGQAVVPLVGGKGHCTGRSTTSHKHWRCGTTRVCSSGWRSPTLDRSGFAGPNIIATQAYLRERTDLASRNTPSLRPLVNKGSTGCQAFRELILEATAALYERKLSLA